VEVQTLMSFDRNRLQRMIHKRCHWDGPNFNLPGSDAFVAEFVGQCIASSLIDRGKSVAIKKEQTQSTRSAR
jgi:hypothetical protein